MDPRLQNEIEHGKFLATNGAGQIWNWESPAGKVRWRRRVQMLTAELRPEMSVLEIGCGTGYFTQELAKTGARITAIDISPDLLEQARAKVTASNVTFRLENAYALTFEAASFDAVIGSSVLHHLDVVRALMEFRRVLKPGGLLRFTEPNYLNPQIAVQKNVPELKRLAGDSPDETAFIRWTLRRQLVEIGFDQIEIVPFDFLHPAVPRPLIPLIERMGALAERIPVVREISGSLHLVARRAA